MDLSPRFRKAYQIVLDSIHVPRLNFKGTVVLGRQHPEDAVLLEDPFRKVLDEVSIYSGEPVES